VVAPEAPPPGNGSPGAAVTGFLNAANAKNPAAICGYLLPSIGPQCRSAFSAFNEVNPGAPSPQAPFARNTRIGYIAIDGSDALVGTTGQYCAQGETPECAFTAYRGPD
jgi:hypothetical protein